MSDPKIVELSQEDIERLRADAELLGLRVYTYIPPQRQSISGRGDTARAIRARQTQIAQRSSVDIIREERDAL
jgi:hypothetical protein